MRNIITNMKPKLNQKDGVLSQETESHSEQVNAGHEHLEGHPGEASSRVSKEILDRVDLILDIVKNRSKEKV